MRVRFDGGHKYDACIAKTLGRCFEFVPVCPEVEAGFGVPRPSLHLEGDADHPRMIVTRTGEDVTVRMQDWARGRLEELVRMDLDGYILKKSSPSCGMERVKVDGQKGAPRADGQKGAPRAAGRGLFAAALMERLPLLPVEEEGRLQDAGLRENFVERVFAHFRWKEFLRSHPGPRDLVEWHTRHKMTLLAHGCRSYTRLGQLVATTGTRRFDQVLGEYGMQFMQALRQRATRGRLRNHA